MGILTLSKDTNNYIDLEQQKEWCATNEKQAKPQINPPISCSLVSHVTLGMWTRKTLVIG